MIRLGLYDPTPPTHLLWVPSPPCSLDFGASTFFSGFLYQVRALLPFYIKRTSRKSLSLIIQFCLLFRTLFDALLHMAKLGRTSTLSSIRIHNFKNGRLQSYFRLRHLTLGIRWSVQPHFGHDNSLLLHKPSYRYRRDQTRFGAFTPIMVLKTL